MYCCVLISGLFLYKLSNCLYKLSKQFVQTVQTVNLPLPNGIKATFPQSFLLRLAMLLTRLFSFFGGSSETAGLSSLCSMFTKQKIKYTFAHTRVQKSSIQTFYVKTVQEYETRIGTCVKVMYGNVMSGISLLKMQLWDEHETGSGYYVNCQLSGTAEQRRWRKVHPFTLPTYPDQTLLCCWCVFAKVALQARLYQALSKVLLLFSRNLGKLGLKTACPVSQVPDLLGNGEDNIFRSVSRL